MIVNLLLSILTASMRPAHITLIANRVQASEQSVAQAAYNQWTAIGNIFGPPLGGVLYQSFNGMVSMITAGILFLGATGYTWFASKKNP